MLHVQKWLQDNNGDFALLKETLGISANFSNVDDRVILNYSQIDSPKTDPIVMECRGLVLDRNTFEVVARAFNRFFNYGEVPEFDNKFDWNNFVAQEKEDGSLILIYEYNGEIHVNTRNSYGHGEMMPESNKTWKDMVFSLLPNSFKPLPGLTYVCELCTSYNKVVRTYSEPKLFLIDVIDTMGDNWVDYFAHACVFLGLDPIKNHKIDGTSDIDWLTNYIREISEDDPTFEGLVLKDKDNNRTKLKSVKYISLHRLKGNGNLFMSKNLLPFILDGEEDEVLLHFPEAKPKVEKIKEMLKTWTTELDNLWFCFGDLDNRKKFAEKVIHHPLSCMLFKAKDLGVNPTTLLKEFEGTLLKLIIKELKEKEYV